MKKLQHHGVLLGIGVLGASALISFAEPVSAQPGKNNGKAQKDNRGRDSHGRNDGNRSDDNRGRASQNERRQFRTVEGVVASDQQGNNFTLRVGRQELRVQVQGGDWNSIRRGDRVRAYGFSSGNIFHAQNVRILNRRSDDRDRDDRDRDDRDGDRDDRQTFTGTVVTVRGIQSFDIHINGRTYNVFTHSPLPRELSRTDVVRVYGERVGADDIKNANVVILTDR